MIANEINVDDDLLCVAKVALETNYQQKEINNNRSTIKNSFNKNPKTQLMFHYEYNFVGLQLSTSLFKCCRCLRNVVSHVSNASASKMLLNQSHTR